MAHPNVITVEMPRCGRADTFRLYPIGDIHDGTICCDWKRFVAFCKMVHDDPFGYWYGMGDESEYIVISDPRFVGDNIAEWVRQIDLSDLPRQQMLHVLQPLLPIAPKCLGLIEGNHSYKIKQKYHYDVYKHFCEEMEKAAGRPLQMNGEGVSRLQFRRGKGTRALVQGWLHHGATAANTPGGRVAALDRYLLTHQGDFAIMGHCHSHDIASSAEKRVADNGEIYVAPKRGIFGGTFYDDTLSHGRAYSVRNAYRPIAPGYSYLEITPFAPNPAKRLRVVTEG